MGTPPCGTFVVENYPDSLRVYPAVVQVERVAMSDDILPLKFPIVSESGDVLESIRVKEGQVST